ncbi:MAG: hypothetical protein QOK20_1070, partial [Acidimicrobiaceae bacterium]|nr:hypothetical protein [Acidimicrobiaceae bacterium]
MLRESGTTDGAGAAKVSFAVPHDSHLGPGWHCVVANATADASPEVALAIFEVTASPSAPIPAAPTSPTAITVIEPMVEEGGKSGGAAGIVGSGKVESEADRAEAVAQRAPEPPTSMGSGDQPGEATTVSAPPGAAGAESDVRTGKTRPRHRRSRGSDVVPARAPKRAPRRKRTDRPGATPEPLPPTSGDHQTRPASPPPPAPPLTDQTPRPAAEPPAPPPTDQTPRPAPEPPPPIPATLSRAAPAEPPAPSPTHQARRTTLKPSPPSPGIQVRRPAPKSPLSPADQVRPPASERRPPPRTDQVLRPPQKPPARSPAAVDRSATPDSPPRSSATRARPAPQPPSRTRAVQVRPPTPSPVRLDRTDQSSRRPGTTDAAAPAVRPRAGVGVLLAVAVLGGGLLAAGGLPAPPPGQSVSDQVAAILDPPGGPQGSDAPPIS